MIVSNCLAIFFSVETEQADAVADVDASVRRKFRTSTVALLDFFFGFCFYCRSVVNSLVIFPVSNVANKK